MIKVSEYTMKLFFIQEPIAWQRGEGKGEVTPKLKRNRDEE